MDALWIIRYSLVVICFTLVQCRDFNRTALHRNNENYEKHQNLSQHFQSCHYMDPDVTDCLRQSAEYAKTLLAQGIPSLGISSLEPLKVPNVRLRQHNAPKNGFKYDAWLSDVMVKGLTNYDINTLDVFPKEMKLTANLSLPNLYMTSNIIILGHFQMLPVEAMGMLSANFSTCTAKLVAEGARVHNLMVIRDSDVTLLCTGDLQTDLEDADLGNGDKADIADHIVNMHSEEIVKEIKPAVETALSMVLEDLANKFLKHVPFDQVFPN